MINLIAILSRETHAIGKDGGLIWNNPTDLARFRDLTRERPVIMGRKTWESLPENRRPLPNRTNIVVSRDASYEAPGATVVTTLEDALRIAKEAPGGDDIWVIGGGMIYALAMSYADRLYLTLVDDPVDGDAHFPEWKGWDVIEESEPSVDENGKRYRFVTLARPASTS